MNSIKKLARATALAFAFLFSLQSSALTPVEPSGDGGSEIQTAYFSSYKQASNFCQYFNCISITGSGFSWEVVYLIVDPDPGPDKPDKPVGE